MITEEIQKASYWEHFKYAKELALIYPVEHPKRKVIESELNKMQQLIKNERTT